MPDGLEKILIGTKAPSTRKIEEYILAIDKAADCFIFGAKKDKGVK